jgi:hypothetical protein
MHDQQLAVFGLAALEQLLNIDPRPYRERPLRVVGHFEKFLLGRTFALGLAQQVEGDGVDPRHYFLRVPQLRTPLPTLHPGGLSDFLGFSRTHASRSDKAQGSLEALFIEGAKLTRIDLSVWWFFWGLSFFVSVCI